MKYVQTFQTARLLLLHGSLSFQALPTGCLITPSCAACDTCFCGRPLGRFGPSMMSFGFGGRPRLRRGGVGGVGSGWRWEYPEIAHCAVTDIFDKAGQRVMPCNAVRHDRSALLCHYCPQTWVPPLALGFRSCQFINAQLLINQPMAACKQSGPLVSRLTCL